MTYIIKYVFIFVLCFALVLSMTACNTAKFSENMDNSQVSIETNQTTSKTNSEESSDTTRIDYENSSFTPIVSDSDSIKIGDLVSYGNYEQDGNTDNGSENIDWIVLEKENDRMLLISRFALDCQLYDSTHWGDMSWEICTLRQWLNNDFFDSAFNSEEKSKILSYTTESNLSDNVFLLNKEEADQYLTGKTKMCRATKYARNKGVYRAYNNNCVWWIRSDGETDYIPCIDYNGDYDTGNAIRSSNYAVRPAIWVSSDASVKASSSQ